LERRRSVDETKPGPEPACVERRAREGVDRREIRTANVADIAVHAFKTDLGKKTERWEV